MKEEYRIYVRYIKKQANNKKIWCVCIWYQMHMNDEYW